jgi:hypothetical protein
MSAGSVWRPKWPKIPVLAAGEGSPPSLVARLAGPLIGRAISGPRSPWPAPYAASPSPARLAIRGALPPELVNRRGIMRRGLPYVSFANFTTNSDLAVGARTSGTAVRASVILGGDQLAMPSQQRFRCHDAGGSA